MKLKEAAKIRALPCLLAFMLCMTVFSTTAFADGGDYYDYELPLETAESGQPFSEESEIYTRDLLYDQDAHKQFITIQDRDGNTCGVCNVNGITAKSPGV